MAKSNVTLNSLQKMATEIVADGVDQVHYQQVSSVAIGQAPKPMTRLLRNDLNSIEMNVDGSTTAVDFDLAPGASEVFRVDRINLLMEAAGSSPPGNFGNLAALTNGLVIGVQNATTQILDLSDGAPIQTNAQLGMFAETVVSDNLSGGFVITATFDLCSTIRLEGSEGEYLRATVQDDLTGLTSLRMVAIGCIETDRT